MKILNYIIFIYYQPWKGYKEKGLEAGILIATLPISFFLIALFFFLSQFIIPKQINFFNPITYGVIGGLIFISVNRFLKRRYLGNIEIIKDFERFNNRVFKLLIIIFSFCIYVVSVIAVFYSFKFT